MQEATVILTCYNNKRYFREAVDSVQGVFVKHLCVVKGEQDGEADKPGESFGELAMASGYASIALDSLEEVFYPLTTPVEHCGEWHSRSAVTASRNAGVYSFRGCCLPEGRAIHRLCRQ